MSACIISKIGLIVWHVHTRLFSPTGLLSRCESLILKGWSSYKIAMAWTSLYFSQSQYSTDFKKKKKKKRHCLHFVPLATTMTAGRIREVKKLGGERHFKEHKWRKQQTCSPSSLNAEAAERASMKPKCTWSKQQKWEHAFRHSPSALGFPEQALGCQTPRIQSSATHSCLVHIHTWFPSTGHSNK